MPALLAHDARQQVSEHGVAGTVDQAGVTGLGRPLVDGAPRHVDGGEGVAGEARSQRVQQRRQAVPHAEAPAHLADPARPVGLVVRGEHPADGLPVPHLLVAPHGEEGRHGGIAMRRRDEQVAQVADGVVLDVVHVAQAADDLGGQRLVAECVEVDARQVDGGGPVAVAVDVASHAPGSERSGTVDEGDVRRSAGGLALGDDLIGRRRDHAARDLGRDGHGGGAGRDRHRDDRRGAVADGAK